MKLFSNACVYVLRSVTWLGQRPKVSCKVREIALAIDAAPGYLIKVLQMLAYEKILAAHRGRRGGYQLVCDPASITVLDIVRIIDPIERILTCPLHLKAHGLHLCSMHRQIDDAMSILQASLGMSTLLELIDTTHHLVHPDEGDNMSLRPSLASTSVVLNVILRWKFKNEAQPSDRTRYLSACSFCAIPADTSHLQPVQPARLWWAERACRIHVALRMLDHWWFIRF